MQTIFHGEGDFSSSPLCYQSVQDMSFCLGVGVFYSFSPDSTDELKFVEVLRTARQARIRSLALQRGFEFPLSALMNLEGLIMPTRVCLNCRGEQGETIFHSGKGFVGFQPGRHAADFLP